MLHGEDSYRSHGNWWTPLHWASKGGHLDVVEYLVSLGANIDAQDWYSKTFIDIAIDQKRDNIVEYLKKIKEEREKPIQRNRRQLLSESLDSSGQPEVAASSGTRPSSWINGLLVWVRSSILPETSGDGANYSGTARNPSNQYISQFSREVCISNNVGLGFFLLQSFLDKKCPLPKFCSVTSEEVLADTLNIMKEFEKTLEKTAKQSGVLVKDVNFLKVYSDIEKQVRNEKYSRIPNTLYSAAKEACPKNEEFLSLLKDNIEKMCNEQQIVNNGYQVQNTAYPSLPKDIADNKPRSYLNDTTVNNQLQRLR